MPQPSDREEEEASQLRERILGTESDIHLKTWYPRLKEAMAELKTLNAQLEERIRQRNEELSLANEELARKNRDLEESRERLLAAERLAEHGRLAGQIAHELNTPLGALLSSSSSLVDETRQGLHEILGKVAELGLEERRFLGELVDEALEKAISHPARSADHDLRKRLAAHIANLGLNEPQDLAEMLLELGIGPESPSLRLKEILDRPGLLALAIALSAPARSAAIARLAALKAADSIHRLGVGGDTEG